MEWIIGISCFLIAVAIFFPKADMAPWEIDEYNYGESEINEDY